VEVDFPQEFRDDEKSDLTPVVLVDRGNCTFVTKVRNIEKLGVKVGVISDNRDELSESLIMSDDGTGQTVTIPSFIIRKRDADLIKETLLNSNSSVYIKAEVEMTHPDNRVEYDLWYSTVTDLESWFMYDLSMYQKTLGSNALFTPRILTYSCQTCSEQYKKDYCLVNGKYCPYFQKAHAPEKLNGIGKGAILYESLRQRCIYEVEHQEQE
jgi:hypothetical protein